MPSKFALEQTARRILNAQLEQWRREGKPVPRQSVARKKQMAAIIIKQMKAAEGKTVVMAADGPPTE